MIDLRDIDDCDVFIFRAETKEAGYMTGGRHFESGYAVCSGKVVFVLGDPENVFHHMPQVRCVPTVMEILKLI